MQGKTIDPRRRWNAYKPLRWIEEDRGYKTPCWIWQLHKNEEGYGRVKRWQDGFARPAHAVMYEERVGPIPPGHHIDHLCRVPDCVNPDHLEPVTCAENLRRGRGAKLRHSDVFAIQLMYATTTLTHRAIADVYGVQHAAVGRITRGQGWR